MNPEFGYLLAFATGLLGAFHCLGMCSGLAGGFFAGYGWQRSVVPFITYHGMRILTYTALGIIGALIGRVIVQSGFIGKGQGILMIFSGGLIVLIGVVMLRRTLTSGQAATSTGCSVVQPIKFFDRKRKTGCFSPYIGGVMNGLVPCSLVFSVAIKAAATTEPVRAGLLMLSFGAGTVPTMITVSALGALISYRLKGLFAVLPAVIVIILGVWTLYEGWLFYDIMRGLANW